MTSVAANGDANSQTNGNSNGANSSLNFETFQNIVNGSLVETKAHRTAINPATGEPLWQAPVTTLGDLDTAVAASKIAFRTWSQYSVQDRKAAVLAYSEALEKERAGFVRLLTTEQGKPTAMADYEFTYAVRWMRDMAGLNIPEEIIEDNEERQTVVRYTPLGVVGAIVPWNFPILLATGKIAPALLTGNTIIIKPSPFTPYCGLKLAELAQAYFPPGVVQALSGDDNLGPWLTSHEGIDKISFTGSTATGKAVMASAAKTLKRVTLELGGNDPAIVCADVDIKKTAEKVAFFAFMNSGQVCLCLKRIYIHSSIYEPFREALVEEVKKFKVGNGLEEGTTHGPLQNAMQFERVKGFFAEIEKENWKVAVGGQNDTSKSGYYITPTIIDAPAEDSRLVVEEPFGPIVPILPWADEEDVIQRANNTKLGLGASIWSQDLEQANRIARRLEAGTVWINNHFDLSPTTPFGGVKESGMGVEWGEAGLKTFCNMQAITVNKQWS